MDAKQILMAGRLLGVFGSALSGGLAFKFADPFGAGLSTAFATVGLLCAWFAFLGHLPSHRKAIANAVVFGITAGGVGLLGGLFAALLLAPKSNIAPILGFFISGPFAFSLGTIVGAYWSFASRAGARDRS